MQSSTPGVRASDHALFRIRQPEFAGLLHANFSHHGPGAGRRRSRGGYVSSRITNVSASGSDGFRAYSDSLARKDPAAVTPAVRPTFRETYFLSFQGLLTTPP